MPRQLTQYVVQLGTTAAGTAEDSPPGYQFLEYRGLRYGVQPKRGCGDCHGCGVVTRNSEQSKCDCLWRRLFDARHQAPRPAERLFVSDAPGMVEQLRKRAEVLRKQASEARQAYEATQCNRDEALVKHDQKVEEQQETVRKCEEQHQQVLTDIAHLEKSIDYNTGRADELRAQARELEGQVTKDKATLVNLRSNQLHQVSMERDRAAKKAQTLQEQRERILHDWQKHLRDPQKELRRAEERLSRVEQQLRRLSIEDEPGAEAAVPEEAVPLTIVTAPTAPLQVPVDPLQPVTPPGVVITHTPSHEACLARGVPCSSACPAGMPQPASTTVSAAVEPPPAATTETE